MRFETADGILFELFRCDSEPRARAEGLCFDVEEVLT